MKGRKYRNRRIGELFKEIDLSEKKGTGIPKILRELRKNGLPEPEFDMDEDRTYLNTIIHIRDGFEKKETMSESMSELERTRMQIIFSYLETNKEINSSTAAGLLDVEVKTASRLQTQLNDLQLENQILKNLLDNAGISYKEEILRLRAMEKLCDYDPNQGARIQDPDEITEKMAVMFYSRFWGRQDVYAKRNEKKDTGESSYFTQCHNFWQEGCPKKRREKINCKDCRYRSYKQLTKADILVHLRGKSYNASDVIGVYPLLTDGTCRFLVYDFDNHEKGAEKKDFANEDDTGRILY